MGLRRGDLILVAPPGEFGKPRPALVIQADIAVVDLTVTYLPITSDLARVPYARVPLDPSPENGLLKPSEVMVDLIFTTKVSRVGRVIGRVDRETMQAVEVALMVHLGLV
jgi:mRNA interferase MazF